MDLVKVKRHYQITLPNTFRKKFNIAEGDFIEVEDKEAEIVLRPVKVVHPDQEYFYTKEWQKKETEADKNIEKDELSPEFKKANEGVKWLKK